MRRKAPRTQSHAPLGVSSEATPVRRIQMGAGKSTIIDLPQDAAEKPALKPTLGL
jgi:hypothetical protein